MYGKQILTNKGKKLGFVEDVIIDFESMAISDLMLVGLDELSKSENPSAQISKNTVKYGRVKSISETIIVSDK